MSDHDLLIFFRQNFFCLGQLVSLHLYSVYRGKLVFQVDYCLTVLVVNKLRLCNWRLLERHKVSKFFFPYFFLFLSIHNVDSLHDNFIAVPNDRIASFFPLTYDIHFSRQKYTRLSCSLQIFYFGLAQILFALYLTAINFIVFILHHRLVSFIPRLQAFSNKHRFPKFLRISEALSLIITPIIFPLIIFVNNIVFWGVFIIKTSNLWHIT